MSDEKTKVEKTEKANKTVSLSIGQQLRAAREKQGLSIDEVARQLLLNRQLIMELENDDYSRIPAPVYVRGYLRSYAQLLQLAIELPVAKGVKQVTRESNVRDSKVATPIPPAKTGHHWFTEVAVVILVLLGLLWWHLAKNRAVPVANVVEQLAPPQNFPATQSLPAPANNNVNVEVINPTVNSPLTNSATSISDVATEKKL